MQLNHCMRPRSVTGAVTSREKHAIRGQRGARASQQCKVGAAITRFSSLFTSHCLLCDCQRTVKGGESCIRPFTFLAWSVLAVSRIETAKIAILRTEWLIRRRKNIYKADNETGFISPIQRRGFPRSDLGGDRPLSYLHQL